MFVHYLRQTFEDSYFSYGAGNRCKDENLPEEVIRRIVDVTSDVNLCYSEHARRYILDSGVKRSTLMWSARRCVKSWMTT